MVTVLIAEEALWRGWFMLGEAAPWGWWQREIIAAPAYCLQRLQVWKSSSKDGERWCWWPMKSSDGQDPGFHLPSWVWFFGVSNHLRSRSLCSVWCFLFCYVFVLGWLLCSILVPTIVGFNKWTTEQQQRFHEICSSLVKTQHRTVCW